jgi:hypothetical protein
MIYHKKSLASLSERPEILGLSATTVLVLTACSVLGLFVSLFLKKTMIVTPCIMVAIVFAKTISDLCNQYYYRTGILSKTAKKNV